jgi:glycosyltransferase involved in cell wall biosynthesis
MIKKPLISIIMNCFNGEDYIQQSIESIISQTYQNWELIFWDNNSSDKSIEIFKKYKDPRLRFFSSTNHTILYEARNKAIQKCKGEFLTFLDTDDYWLPSKLQQQIQLFDNEKIGLVYSNYWVINERLFSKRKIFSTKKLPTGKVLDKLLLNYSVGILTVMLRVKFIKNMQNVFNTTYDLLADYDFVINFSIENEFECIQQPLACYRIHDKQTSLKFNTEQIFQMEKWYNLKKLDPFFSKKKEMNQVLKNIRYMKSIKIILDNNFYQSIFEVFKSPFILKKLKLFLSLKIGSLIK